MSKLRLNKSTLSQVKGQLKLYRQSLPALDLKRRQLMAEKTKEERAHAELIAAIAACEAKIGETLPMLAYSPIPLEEMVKIATCEVGEENIVGVRLPVLKNFAVEVTPYSYFVVPHWVDGYVAVMRERLELEVKRRISDQRMEKLAQSVTRVTQRVNLFEHVLIPEAKNNIRRIGIFLADNERAGVVRSKLAKKKQSAASAAQAAQGAEVVA
jgi:V/A-type H+-transporting ATPase subunit D